MKYKNIFFDFNGTILNDVDLCIELLNEMLEMKNHQAINKEYYLDIFTFPIIKYYQKAGFDFKGYTFEELTNHFIVKYQPASYKCNLYEGLVDLFTYLKSKGINLYVLSASKIDNLLLQIENFKIRDFFKDILGINDLFATSKLDLARNYFIKNHIDPSETLFIGDTDHDFEIAKELKADCYLVSFGHQSKKRLSKLTDKVFDSYLEVKNSL